MEPGQLQDTRPGPQADRCPIRGVLDQLSGKWALLMLMILGAKPCRFGELRRIIPDISQRMLTQTLRDLQRDGLVSRTILPSSPPGVEYGLTPLGRSFMTPLAGMIEWANANYDTVQRERDAFDIEGAANPRARL